MLALCYCGELSSKFCAPGFVKDTLTEDCRECPVGTFSTNGATCEKCSPGIGLFSVY